MAHDYKMLDRLLDQTKLQLFLGTQAAFLAPLLGNLEFKWTDEIETSATDYLTIMWNPDDFLKCTPKGRVSTLLHEIQHVYRMHGARRRPEWDNSLWNIACDIVINRDLIELGYALEWPHPGIGEHWEIPHSVEEDIYLYLANSHQGGGGSQPDPSQSGQAGGGLPSGITPKQDFKPAPVGGHCCSGFSKELDPQQKNQIAMVVMQSVQSALAHGDPGSIPGGVQELINNFFKPNIKWEIPFQRWMTEKLEEDYTWSRPNKRIRSAYLPSRVMDDSRLQNLFIYEDVSGSVTKKQATRFNSELKYIWEVLQPEEITIVQFDTQIQKIDVLKVGDPFTEIEIKGRGGTDLECVRQHILQHNPTAAVIFSDMKVRPMKGTKAPCDLLWVLVGNHKVTVPFGELITLPE